MVKKISCIFAVVIITLAFAQGDGERDCTDFSSQEEAQAFFESVGGPNDDPNGLDSDGDGTACEDELGQDDANPVGIRIEAYIVSQVTAEDGSETERFSESTTARPGQIVEYRVFATNQDETTLPPETVSVNGPVPESSTYVDGSATPSSDRIRTEFSVDGETFSEAPETTEGPEAYRAVRWTLLAPLEPAQEERFVYRVTIN